MSEPTTVHRRSRRRRWQARGWALLALFVVGLGVSGASGALAYFLPILRVAFLQTGQAVHSTVPSAARPAPAAPGVDTAAQATPSSAFTVLLLGSDDDSKFPSDAVLTQSMILVRVDPAAKHLTMLSIPRDLWVQISSGGMAKVDAAYSDGGAQAAIQTIQNDFDVHIDQYVWVGLRGLIKLIDDLGGVDVTTSNPVLDDWYPADINSRNPYAYQRVAVLAGPQHLNGEEALQYVRSRHGDVQEDFGRSQRQQQLLLALRTRVRNVNVTDIPQIVASFDGELKTSFNLTDFAQMRSLLSLAAGTSSDPAQLQQIILSPPYTSDGVVDGQEVLLPDWPAIQQLVQQTFR